MARELNIHGTLSPHPNILPCYGYCIVEGALGIATKYCSMDLNHYVKRKPAERVLPKKDTRTVIGQISSGLHFLKVQGKHGIVHRELKPGNILLTSINPLNVAIADFGLSKIVRSCNSTMTRVGTVAYMAPEVLDEDWDLRLSNAGDMGHAGDVYSLGVIGFQLATGILLPRATNEERVSRAFEEGRAASGDHTLFSFLESCLRWEPTQRIKKEELLDHEYFQGLTIILDLQSHQVNTY